MNSEVPNPLALVAELTHRCPLHCVYCSNPLSMAARETELSAETWTRVLREAAQMGILQVDFTGGEPLARTDLADLIRAAREAGLYTNLITSGRPLDEKRLEDLVNSGLDHFQLSLQGAREGIADEIAGAKAHAQKLQVARWVKRHRIALTLNFVVHRRNLGQLDEMIAVSEEIGPGRVEFAHVQYYGWAFENLRRLLPTREQLDRSLEILKKTEERLRGRTRVEFVVPDYYARYPKACMGGWGRKILLITPEGDVLPCHAAKIIPAIRFENVQARPLREIWHDSESFRKFRGEHWMPQPCRTCDRRALDFGGCRCQAFLLAHDAAATDPVCSLAPKRGVVDAILSEINRSCAVAATPQKIDWVYRQNPA